MKILRILGIILSCTILYIPIGLFFGSLVQKESRLKGKDDKLGFWLGYSLNLIGVLIFYSPSIKNLLLSKRTFYTIFTFIVLFFVLFFILSSIILTEIQFLYYIIIPICILISISLSTTIVNYFYKKSNENQ